MSYIVPAKLPSGCLNCSFAVCNRCYPGWSKTKAGIKVIYCPFLGKSKAIEVDYKDSTAKSVECPLTPFDIKVKEYDYKIKELALIEFAKYLIDNANDITDICDLLPDYLEKLKK